MSFFKTEAKIEDYLNLESKEILMPDGSSRITSQMKMVWNGLNFIVNHSNITQACVAEFAILHSEQANISFDEAFPIMVGYTQRRLRKRLGID